MAALSEARILELRAMYGPEVIILSGGNVYRPEPGTEMNVPEFGFKDAVDPNWNATWQSITARVE